MLGGTDVGGKHFLDLLAIYKLVRLIKKMTKVTYKQTFRAGYYPAQLKEGSLLSLGL
jgi:hypothetical protein